MLLDLFTVYKRYVLRKIYIQEALTSVKEYPSLNAPHVFKSFPHMFRYKKYISPQAIYHLHL